MYLFQWRIRCSHQPELLRKGDRRRLSGSFSQHGRRRNMHSCPLFGRRSNIHTCLPCFFVYCFYFVLFSENTTYMSVHFHVTFLCNTHIRPLLWQKTYYTYASTFMGEDVTYQRLHLWQRSKHTHVTTFMSEDVKHIRIFLLFVFFLLCFVLFFVLFFRRHSLRACTFLCQKT